MQDLINTEVLIWRLGVWGMLTGKMDFPDLHVCILKCFKDHKLDNNLGLKQVSGRY